MVAIVGTVPDENFPLVAGEVSLKGDRICIQNESVPVNRGTPALLAAAIKTSEVSGQSLPFGFLVGDTGRGTGSRRLYEYLEKRVCDFEFKTIAFHYLQPDVDWHNRVLFAIQEMRPQPLLIADAGFMYAAKMSGQSEAYDLFTPDAGELAFLADEEAPHPFYTRGFILHEENHVPELIARAYAHKNAAKHLLIKGKKDYIVSRQNILETVDSPVAKTMETIGGTGDTLTGIVTMLAGSGMEISNACVIAARVNRLAGYNSNPTPATQISDIISHISNSLELDSRKFWLVN
ncbi:NAD(P)H-hydrate dehydratase [Desulfonema magnum]|uniref:Carbohydrate kinase family protein n=1 Tax=Desulfonema magnum TaxID=45655 RepID=A0A975GQ13_9BACT|nr:NAD(P)H-hydrate dehydratase [Desulfonema magnum]QTA89399.1 Carbohydrate kinase family protein [Desulfonema magnum]